jgi:hypothetical protein
MAEFLLHPFNLHYGFLSDGASCAKTGYHPGRKQDGIAEFVSGLSPPSDQRLPRARKRGRVSMEEYQDEPVSDAVAVNGCCQGRFL